MLTITVKLRIPLFYMILLINIMRKVNLPKALLGVRVKLT